MMKDNGSRNVPPETIRVARAAFPEGNRYLLLRDADVADLCPRRGQPALPPWRLALVTLVQYRENLSDRQAAEAVRCRIDVKYLLGLALEDAGFDYSVLCEFRARLLAGSGEEMLLDRLLIRCRELGLVRERSRARTDATRVLAAMRVMNRLELIAETLRATLNELARVAPGWLRMVALEPWYERYGKRIEDSRLPRSKAEREEYARTVGEDGAHLLELLSTAPAELAGLPVVGVLERVWERHYQHEPQVDGGVTVRVRPRPERELARAVEATESPYEPDARYRSLYAVEWTGYLAHLTETCEEDAPRLITHVDTTSATVREVRRVEAIHQALAAKDLLPGEHLADAAYIDAKLLVKVQNDYGVRLIGPPHKDASWQARTEGAFTNEDFVIDWDREQVRCPQGHESNSWRMYEDDTRGQYVLVRVRNATCRACPLRERCTRSHRQGRSLRLHPREAHDAITSMRDYLAEDTGHKVYGLRAGVEGTISQGTRSFGLRHARYRGLAKVHLQHVATAAAMNIDRVTAFLEGRPLESTRTSRFAALRV
jgi:transposase